MTVECPRCSLHPTLAQTATWIATGHSNHRRFGRECACLRCVQCGHAWSSGLPEALEVLRQVRLEAGEALPVSAPTVPIPAPTLFGAEIGRESQGFVSTGKLAKVIAIDFKKKASGDA